MTEKEKASAMNHIEAAIACGGGKMMADCKALVSDVLDGKLTEDEAIEKIKIEYGVRT